MSPINQSHYFVRSVLIYDLGVIFQIIKSKVFLATSQPKKGEKLERTQKNPD
jgi:hypothetical protein